MMTKNITHKISLCHTRNELIDALNEKSVVIEISPKLKNEIRDEFLKQYKNYGLGKTATALGIVNLVLSIPTGCITLMEFIFCVFLAGNGLSITNTDFKDYRIAFFRINREDRFLFVSEKYNYEYDSVMSLEAYQLIKYKLTKKCTACEHDIGKEIDWAVNEGINPFYCHACNQKVIWTIKPQLFAKEEQKKVKGENPKRLESRVMVVERSRKRTLHKMGLPADKDYSVSDNLISSVCEENEMPLFRSTISDVMEYKKKLKNHELISEPLLSPADGKIYKLIQAFYSSEFGTADSEASIINLIRFINIRRRQISGNPMRGEKRGCKEIQKCFASGAPRLDENDMYENVLKEAAWIAVHSYLFQVFASPKEILQLIPKAGMPAIEMWNSYLEKMQDAPESVIQLFILDKNGNCEFLKQALIEN